VQAGICLCTVKKTLLKRSADNTKDDADSRVDNNAVKLQQLTPVTKDIGMQNVGMR